MPQSRRVRQLRARLAAVLPALRAAGRRVTRRERRLRFSPFALLRRRLVLTNLVVAAIVLTALSGGIYAYEAAAQGQQMDQTVRSEAQHEAQNTHAFNTVDHEPPEAMYQADSPNLFSIILAAPRRVVQDDDQAARYGLPDWVSAQAVLDGKEPDAIATVRRGNYAFRLYTVPIRDHGQIIGAVQSGSSFALVNRHLQDLRRVLLLLGGGVLLLTALSSIILTERALAPARAAFVRQRQFAAGASHELRTPLAFIRSQAELIASQARERHEPAAGARAVRTTDGTAEDEQIAADAQEIIAEAAYMSRLVSDLLVLARDERDRMPLAWRTLDLAALASEVAAKMRPLAEARGVRLEVEHQSRSENRPERHPEKRFERTDAVPIHGGEDRMRQLILILLDNAIQYTPAGGDVRIGVKAVRRSHLRWERSGQASLRVCDSGIGIAPDHLPHIFEPFYRVAVAPGHRHAESSTGLGLALAQWIVQAHDGTIKVKSTPGEGSVFTVTLPLATRREPAEASHD